MKKIKGYLRSRISNLIDAKLAERSEVDSARLQDLLNSKVDRSTLKEAVGLIINESIRIWGDDSKVHLHPTAQLTNTLFNTSSGEIWVGEDSFSGHNVSLITGTHNFETFGHDRQAHFPTSGHDIVIGCGVWLGSNSVVLGPSNVGDHAVIAAGCIVVPGTNVPRGGIVAGVPGKVIRVLEDIPN